MIIDRNGNLLQVFRSIDGIIVHDGKYAICLEFNAVQKVQMQRINQLKAYLNSTDYQAIKYSDGAITEEDYAPIREQRKAARAEINAIEAEYTPPTITREEMDYAEAKAEENEKKRVPDYVLAE